jgi:hypothetical protein
MRRTTPQRETVSRIPWRVLAVIVAALVAGLALWRAFRGEGPTTPSAREAGAPIPEMAVKVGDADSQSPTPAPASADRDSSAAADPGRDPPGKKWVLIESYKDENCDGVRDADCRSTTYGPSRRTEEERIDEDCDGHPEARIARTWDAGHRKRWSKRYGASGGDPELCTFREYNDEEAEIAYVRDEACDGESEEEIRTLVDDGTVKTIRRVKDGYVRCVTTKRDDEGRVVDEREYPGCEDEATTCTATTYEKQGGTTVETDRTDYGCDGTEDESARWVRDAEDRVVAFSAREWGRLTFDTWTTEEAGGERRWYRDENADGKPELCTRFTPDRGQRRRVFRKDEGCDGTWDECRESVKDARGNLVRESVDERCDGTPDRDCRVWVYGFR